MTAKSAYTDIIKAEALRLGFLACGVSKAEFLEEEARHMEEWLSKGYHGSMSWLERNFDKRLDPRKLVPGAKSVISVMMNYYPEQQQRDSEAPKIAKYAYGEDYHFVMRERLKSLMDFITENIGEVEGRAFVDSAPVMERAWAERSGLGWIGKHSLLLSQGAGSFYFLGELILDLDLEPDHPVTDHCGSCTRCIDACPTNAILAPEVLDSNKCISHLTIELKEAIPMSFKEEMQNWAFGCDICQDVCPWNRFSTPHTEDRFKPHPEMLDMSAKDWHEITEEVFAKVFRKSAVKRTKYEGLNRNLRFLQS